MNQVVQLQATVESPSGILATVSRLEAEIGKLKDHRAELEEKARESRAKLKAAASTMESAQQQAIIDGNASGYAEARQTFDAEAQVEAKLQQEIRSMTSGIDTRHTQVNELRSRLKALETAAVKAWSAKHQEKIEKKFHEALGSVMALNHLLFGTRPAPDAMAKKYMVEADGYYQKALAKFRSEAGL